MTKKEYWLKVHRDLSDKTGISAKAISSVRSCALGDKWDREKIFQHFSNKFNNTKIENRMAYCKEAMNICSDLSIWKIITDNSYKYVANSG